MPIYPSAQYITSYDAGRGQRFYLFGVERAVRRDRSRSTATALKHKGDELFESPPTHQFEIGRFREETMAFPPSVTVKDYTWGGSAGYPESEARRTAGALPDDHSDRPARRQSAGLAIRSRAR